MGLIKYLIKFINTASKFTGDPTFLGTPVKQVIHVFVLGVVLVVFTMKYMKGLKVFFFIIFMAFMVIITHPTLPQFYFML